MSVSFLLQPFLSVPVIDCEMHEEGDSGPQAGCRPGDGPDPVDSLSEHRATGNFLSQRRPPLAGGGG